MRANLGIGWQLENGNKKIMKYWKKGFYDEPQGGAVEITEEYYNQLLEGQSTGFEIQENTENYPILVKIEPIIIAPTYEELVEISIRERYTVSQELAILRQKEEKPDEYQIYYAYAEECKSRAKDKLGNG